MDFYSSTLHLFIVCVLPISLNATSVEVEGLVQLNYVKGDKQSSWFDKGSGILAYSKDSANVQQAFIELSDNFSNGLSYAVVANYYQLGEQNVGISQAQVSYKPFH